MIKSRSQRLFYFVARDVARMAICGCLAGEGMLVATVDHFPFGTAFAARLAATILVINEKIILLPICSRGHRSIQRGPDGPAASGWF